MAASEADVAALERAARPVYDTLEADPQTEAFIEQIRDLKNGSTAAEPAVSCASS